MFDDLEDQLASEWEAERAALDTEAERLRLSRVALREWLEAIAGQAGGATPSIELVDGTVLSGHVEGVGADWIALEPSGSRPATLLVPLSSIASIGMAHADVLRSARPAATARSPLADRLTLGYVLRDLVRRRAGVALQLATGRLLTGTIDRAGADHLDLALHDPGAPRRASEVTGHRLVAFSAIAFVRVEHPTALV
nr:hypothetical protein [Microbacterium ulmi]